MHLGTLIILTAIALIIVNEVNYSANKRKRIERSKKALEDDRPKYFH